MTTWDEVLPIVEFVYKNSVNRSTKLSPLDVVIDSQGIDLGNL